MPPRRAKKKVVKTMTTKVVEGRVEVAVVATSGSQPLPVSPKMPKEIPIQDMEGDQVRQQNIEEETNQIRTNRPKVLGGFPSPRKEDKPVSQPKAGPGHAEEEEKGKGTRKRGRPPKAEGDGTTKRRRRMKEGGGIRFKRYLYRVLKQVHPELGITQSIYSALSFASCLYS